MYLSSVKTLYIFIYVMKLMASNINSFKQCRGHIFIHWAYCNLRDQIIWRRARENFVSYYSIMAVYSFRFFFRGCFSFSLFILCYRFWRIKTNMLAALTVLSVLYRPCKRWIVDYGQLESYISQPY